VPAVTHGTANVHPWKRGPFSPGARFGFPPELYQFGLVLKQPELGFFRFLERWESGGHHRLVGRGVGVSFEVQVPGGNGPCPGKYFLTGHPYLAWWAFGAVAYFFSTIKHP
jgi:hypothetical protein